VNSHGLVVDSGQWETVVMASTSRKLGFQKNPRSRGWACTACGWAKPILRIVESASLNWESTPIGGNFSMTPHSPTAICLLQARHGRRVTAQKLGLRREAVVTTCSLLADNSCCQTSTKTAPLDLVNTKSGLPKRCTWRRRCDIGDHQNQQQYQRLECHRAVFRQIVRNAMPRSTREPRLACHPN
jgi:hypothetical protein